MYARLRKTGNEWMKKVISEERHQGWIKETRKIENEMNIKIEDLDQTTGKLKTEIDKMKQNSRKK